MYRPTHVVEVLLVIGSVDLKSGQASYLLRETDKGLALLTAPLGEQEGSLQVAARLLEWATGLKAHLMGSGWVDLVPFPVVDNVDRYQRVEDDMGAWDVRVIGIPVGAVLPAEHATLSDPALKWVPLADTLDRKFVGDHLDILQAVTSRL